MNTKKNYSKLIRIVLAVVLALALTLAVTSCDVNSLFDRSSGSSSTKTIDGTYQLSVGDPTVEIGDSDVAEKIAYLMMPATVEIFSSETYKNTTYSSGGTGFIISDDGYVVTNSHVIHYTAKYTSGNGIWGQNVTEEKLYSNASIKLKFYSDSSTFSCKVVAYDEDLDLAILKFDNLPEGGFERTVTFADSSKLTYGQVAVAIGNANGYGLAVTQGVVSAPSRVFDNGDGTTTEAIQTDAAINPGNSGGPLFNKKAQVIGVNSFKVITENTENMGYAIPSNIVMKYIDSVNKANKLSIQYQTV